VRCWQRYTQRDAIHFALGDKATITLGSTLPTITDTSGLNINGRRAKITVSGDDFERVFQVNPGAKLTLANLTVADGRSVAFGGGLENFGTVKVFNSTFSGNSVHLDIGGGGGIFNDGGTLTVTNSTFSENRAGNGGAIFNSGTATLRNTIVANSPSGGNCANLGTLVDGGYNIDDGTSCGFSSANNSFPSTNPLLDPNGLANNGGPTKTIKLLEGSPAINAIPQGTNGCGTEVKTDQRGVSRPQGKKCDISAFEKKVRRR
jgi:hypothetical protein